MVVDFLVVCQPDQDQKEVKEVEKQEVEVEAAKIGEEEVEESK